MEFYTIIWSTIISFLSLKINKIVFKMLRI